jgi:hypothetical protein
LGNHGLALDLLPAEGAVLYGPVSIYQLEIGPVFSNSVIESFEDFWVVIIGKPAWKAKRPPKCAVGRNASSLPLFVGMWTIGGDVFEDDFCKVRLLSQHDCTHGSGHQLRTVGRSMA